MKARALDVYVCPVCIGTLRLQTRARSGPEVIDGTLTCTTCGSEYPITRGVPRFVPDGAYAGSFGYQWNWFRTVQLDSQTAANRSNQALFETTGWSDEEYRGRRLLDAGAGAGRFAEQAAAKGADVFGVDLTEAVDAAWDNIGSHANIHLAQADVFSLPFRPGTFDLAYSIGVLHHTPDPAGAFACIAPTIKSGGRFAVYLYARYGLAHRASDALRVATTRMPLRIMWAVSALAVPLYYLYRVPIVGKIAGLTLPISMEPHWRWRWLDTFDWYTPKYQWKFLYPEIFHWFRSNGFEDVMLFDGPIRMCGRKRPAPESVYERFRCDSLVAS
jgi:SAM-dependent methyltransferase